MRIVDVKMPGSPLSWRLLAANNRDVARSATPYPDLAGCLNAVAELQARIEDGVVMAARSGRADWSWRLRLDGHDVAISSRTYQRRLQCEAACALFVSLVPGATLDLFEYGATDHAGAAVGSVSFRVADADADAADAVVNLTGAGPEPVLVDPGLVGGPAHLPRPRTTGAPRKCRSFVDVGCET